MAIYSCAAFREIERAPSILLSISYILVSIIHLSVIVRCSNLSDTIVIPLHITCFFSVVRFVSD